ncbi:MAG: hypothetical protein QNJ36_10815 [Calothrix sp. MO_167.B42]|nr:hypothetical protein [Calothrix sp. MO_167.B42]
MRTSSADINDGFAFEANNNLAQLEEIVVNRCTSPFIDTICCDSIFTIFIK